MIDRVDTSERLSYLSDGLSVSFPRSIVMKRFLQVAASIVGVLLLGVILFFLWASSGHLDEEELAQTKTYQAEPAPSDRDTFTVMTYNIGYLSGMTNNEPVVRSDSLFQANMDQALDLIDRADPDFIGFQEIDFGAARSADVHQLDTIATRLGYASGAQAVNWDERYVPFPYGRPAVHFGRVLSGQAILSRYPLRRHVRKELTRPSQPFFRDAFYLDRLAQIAVADIGGWPLVIINVHLEAFDTETREEQARTVNELYKRLAQQGFPILLIGDTNSVMPAAKTAMAPDLRTSFAEDQTMELLLEGTDLNPAFSEGAYVTGEPINTFPANNPNRKIDHIFSRSRYITPVDTETYCKAPHQPPSDHCALAMSFLLPRPKDELPDDPIPDEDLPSLDSLLAR